MCSETDPPRFSFSHDLSKEHVKEEEIIIPRKDTMLLESNSGFEFSTSLDFESSSADELFSNGVILPVQIQQHRKTTMNEPAYTRLLPPRPSSQKSFDKVNKEILAVNNYNSVHEQNTQFNRSRSLNCDAKKSLMWLSSSSTPPLSRSNSTGSAPKNPKRMSSNKQAYSSANNKSLLSSSSSSSALNLYPLQKSSSGKSYANGQRISPVLNVPTPYVSKGSLSFFGLGSFLRVGKAKKSKT